MIRIEEHTLQSIGENEYRRYFEESFGLYDETHIPCNIILVLDDNLVVGFASWYIHNAVTMYLQCIGFVNNTKKRYSYFCEAIKFLEGKGVSIMGVMYNDNKTGIIWALRSGFKIIGTRALSSGSVLVEIIKEKQLWP